MEKMTVPTQWGNVKVTFLGVPVASYYEGEPCWDMMTARFMQEITKCFDENGVERITFNLDGLEDARSTREKQNQYVACLDALIKKERLNGTYDGDVLLHATNFTDKGE